MARLLVQEGTDSPGSAAALLSPLLTWTVRFMAAGERPGGYLVQAEHPDFGTIGETFANMPAAIARAVELLREGYTAEILSVSSLAPR